MSLLVVGAVDPDAPLARRDPVAKLVAATIPVVALVVTVDLLTPTLLLLAEAVAVPLAGLGPGRLLRRAWPLALGALSIAVANTVFAADRSGAVLLDAGPLEITTGSLLAGLAAALRLLAIALPGILVVVTTDPVDLADSLVQRARVSARFAYGALAALRLLPLLAREWEAIGRAHRARGFDAGRNPLAAGRLLAARVFALLVAAIRRGTRLATAMDARGFDAGVPRTVARPVHASPADGALVAASVLVTTAVVAVSVALGAWEPLYA